MSNWKAAAWIWLCAVGLALFAAMPPDGRRAVLGLMLTTLAVAGTIVALVVVVN